MNLLPPQHHMLKDEDFYNDRIWDYLKIRVKIPIRYFHVPRHKWLRHKLDRENNLEAIVSYCCFITGERWYEKESLILQNPEAALLYAEYVLGCQSPTHSRADGLGLQSFRRRLTCIWAEELSVEL